MNILAIIFHFPPMSGGGVIVSVEIINNLARLGHKITVITPDIEWNGPIHNPDIEQNVKIIRVKVPSRDKIKIAARRCRKYLKKEAERIGNDKKIDLIFTIFHPFHMATHAAVDYGNMANVPIIVKVDDAVYEKSHGLKSIQRMIEKRFNTKALNKANTILVSNKETKKTVNEFYGVNNDKIKIVTNGVNTKKFNHVYTESKKIIFTGVMYNHRGLDVLIDAASIIVKEIPEAEIELYGDGPDLLKLKSLTKQKKLESNIKFMGWISNEEIPKILATGAIGIGPLQSTDVTRNALPIKILEYMASSLPIVAAFDTLSKDILLDKENGYFIKNYQDLASKIIDILSDKNKQKSMGEKSLEIAKNYDWNIIVKKILE